MRLCTWKKWNLNSAECVVQENIHTNTINRKLEGKAERTAISWVRGVGWGFQTQKPFMGGVWIFFWSNKKMFTLYECSYIWLQNARVHVSSDRRNFLSNNFLKCQTTNLKIYTLKSNSLHTCTWRVVTNCIVLTIASDAPASKLYLTVSTKWLASTLMSTNTYNILIPFVESIGTMERVTSTFDYITYYCSFIFPYLAGALMVVTNITSLLR